MSVLIIDFKYYKEKSVECLTQTKKSTNNIYAEACGLEIVMQEVVFGKSISD